MRFRPEYTLHDLLHNSVARDPQKAAVVDGDAQYTYEDLERESSALGAALVDAGVGRGDRVGVLVEKSWEAIVAMVAASRIGAAYVNVNPLFKAPQVEYLAGDCEIRVMIGDTQKLEELSPKTVETAFYRGAKPEGYAARSYVDVAEALRGDGLEEDRRVSESDLATILYTSGSTGMPKGVATSQRNVVVGAQIVSEYLENTPEDRILSALPLNFDAGMSQFTTSLRAGATPYLLRSRLPGDLLKALRRDEITGVLIGLFHLRQPFGRLVAQVLELLKFLVQHCRRRLDGVRRLALFGGCDDARCDPGAPIFCRSIGIRQHVEERA